MTVYLPVKVLGCKGLWKSNTRKVLVIGLHHSPSAPVGIEDDSFDLSLE